MLDNFLISKISIAMDNKPLQEERQQNRSNTVFFFLTIPDFQGM